MGGRFVAPGFGAPWTFYPVVAVFGGIAIYVILQATVPTIEPVVLIWLVLAWWVLVALLWYFVIGRIPDRIRVSTLRKQCPEAALVRGVHLGRTTQLWIVATIRSTRARRPSQFGVAVVSTETELQFWMGSASDPAPVATLRWRDVSSVTTRGSAGIRIHIGSDNSALDFRVVNTSWFSTVLARGAARDRVVDLFAHYSQDDSQ